MSTKRTAWPPPPNYAITPRCLVPNLLHPDRRGYRCGRMAKAFRNYRETLKAHND